VFIHATFTKSNETVLRCTLDGSQSGRWLEIPTWMFDRAACEAIISFSAAPFVDVEALQALSALLKIIPSSSNALFPAAYGISRDENRGDIHGTEDRGTSGSEG